jgi:uncharacterized protein
MKIAIIGSGITGLGAAWLLNHHHINFTLFEADMRLGGHANTVSGDNHADVDTGFIVFNEWTYPNMMALFNLNNVPFIKSNMGFAISTKGGDLEYSSDALFAQRKNIFNPHFYRMIIDLIRFYRAANRDLPIMSHDLTLGEYLNQGRYSNIFINHHLIPMGAAIWSMGADDMMGFPMASFTRFCVNHGLLNLINRPQWFTVNGGSKTYVDILSKPFKDKIKLNTPVQSVVYNDKGVMVDGEHFDRVIICTHPDQALNMLDKPTSNEKSILGDIQYSTNTAILHRDTSQMPKNKKAWAAWNYLSSDNNQVTLTYWMNKLQSFLPADDDLFVTLNPIIPIAPDKIIRTQTYHHPIYSMSAINAQSRIKDIQGVNNIYFAGAWCGYGFHEDGLSAGLAVAEMAANISRPWKIVEKSSSYINVRQQ